MRRSIEYEFFDMHNARNELVRGMRWKGRYSFGQWDLCGLAIRLNAEAVEFQCQKCQFTWTVPSFDSRYDLKDALNTYAFWCKTPTDLIKWMTIAGYDPRDEIMLRTSPDCISHRCIDGLPSRIVAILRIQPAELVLEMQTILYICLQEPNSIATLSNFGTE
jgi:hypothetical protein